MGPGDWDCQLLLEAELRMEAGMDQRGMKTDGKEAEPFLLLAAALDSQSRGCFPGLVGLLGALKRECWVLERLV